jgi:hypothetical protein
MTIHAVPTPPLKRGWKNTITSVYNISPAEENQAEKWLRRKTARLRTALSIATIRTPSMDAVQKANSDHAMTAMAMAPGGQHALA